MIRQICSISAYILKFVTSTFLFIFNGIFKFYLKKCVFGTHIISFKFFAEVLLQVETSSIIKTA